MRGLDPRNPDLLGKRIWAGTHELIASNRCDLRASRHGLAIRRDVGRHARSARIARGCARLLSETKVHQATASCYFPVIRSAGWRSQAGRSRVPGEHGETRDQGLHDGSPPIHIALRAFLRGSRLSFHSRKSARYTRPGHEIVATPRRRRRSEMHDTDRLAAVDHHQLRLLTIRSCGESYEIPIQADAISLRWCRRAFVPRARICSGPPRRRAPASRSGGAGRLTVRSSRSCR